MFEPSETSKTSSIFRRSHRRRCQSMPTPLPPRRRPPADAAAASRSTARRSTAPPGLLKKLKTKVHLHKGSLSELGEPPTSTKNADSKAFGSVMASAAVNSAGILKSENLGIWKIWESRNLEIWEFGNLEIWTSGNLGIRNCGHLEFWQSKNVQKRQKRKL